VKIKKVIKLVEKDGWYLARTTGSHRHYKHPVKKGIVIIAGHPDMDCQKDLELRIETSWINQGGYGWLNTR